MRSGTLMFKTQQRKNCGPFRQRPKMLARHLMRRGCLAHRATAFCCPLQHSSPVAPANHQPFSRRKLLQRIALTPVVSQAGPPSANATTALLTEVAEEVLVVRDSSSTNDSGPPSTSGSNSSFSSSGLLETPVEPPTFVSATGRIVAIGDLHGDLDKAIASLKLAQVIHVDEEGIVSWSGEDTVLVQLGDVLDRGNVEIGIINLLRFLDKEARKRGGAVYMLNGNHESLNVCGDFRYVTPGAYAEAAMFAGLQEDDLRDWALVARVRYALYRPGGDLARELARNPTVLVVNDTVFAHGALLPKHAQYGIQKLNSEVAAWMRGDKLADGSRCPPPLLAMGDANSVMWNRSLSREKFPNAIERMHACYALTQALQMVGGKRLVVGHTPQLGGANCECNNQVWRIDVGMSYGVLNRPVQILEILPAVDGAAEGGERSKVTVNVIRMAGATDSLEADVSALGNL